MKTNIFFALLLIASAVGAVSCNDSILNSDNDHELRVTTNKSSYRIPTSSTKDTIYITLHNNTGSKIYRWYPGENLDIRQVDGIWKTMVVNDVFELYGPIPPGDSMTVKEIILLDDKSGVNGNVFSFNGPAYKDSAVTDSNEILVRSNAFTLTTR